MINSPSLQQKVDDFNVDHPVGSNVTLTSSYGPSMTTTVKAPASIVGGTAVWWLDWVSGCMDLDLIS